MIAVAVSALAMGAFEWVRNRPARLAAIQAARQKAHEAKYLALRERHLADAAAWQKRSIDFGEVDRRGFMAIHHWTRSVKLGDSAEILRRDPVEFVEWPHPDPTDTFPILHGPSEAWDRRLAAHQALTRQCLVRMAFHLQQGGLCFNAAHSPVDAGIFQKQIDAPAPAVDAYPPEFRSEEKPGRKSAQGRTVEPINTGQVGL